MGAGSRTRRKRRLLDGGDRHRIVLLHVAEDGGIGGGVLVVGARHRRTRGPGESDKQEEGKKAYSIGSITMSSDDRRSQNATGAPTSGGLGFRIDEINRRFERKLRRVLAAAIGSSFARMTMNRVAP
ncbi:hypothetical protein NL676_025742 [Syzygium grande]|nr:hypothetical protein NL676_025742 [Syzygium grande]